MTTHDADFFFAMAMTEQRDALQGEIETNKRVEAYRADNQRLVDEVAHLKAEIAGLTEKDKVRRAQIAGLTAELNAYVQDADSCPHEHPLAAKQEYVNGMTGVVETGRASREIYRAAFDAKARELGLDEYETLRR